MERKVTLRSLDFSPYLKQTPTAAIEQGYSSFDSLPKESQAILGAANGIRDIKAELDRLSATFDESIARNVLTFTTAISVSLDLYVKDIEFGYSAPTKTGGLSTLKITLPTNDSKKDLKDKSDGRKEHYDYKVLYFFSRPTQRTETLIKAIKITPASGG